MHIHWHRRDLRGADNLGLAAAVEAASGDDKDGVLPVFVFDPELLAYASPPRVAFMLDALRSLRAWYRERDSDLVLASGSPRVVIPELAATYDADGVTWGADYTGLASARDERVRQALTEAGVETESVHDAVLHEPDTITTNDGDPYRVFTYFGRKWGDRPKDDPVDPPAAAELVALRDDDPVPTLADLGFAEPDADVPPAGSDPARDRLSNFCAGDIYRYERDRDYPAADGTSRLSAHLRWGTIGIREVYAATERARKRAQSADVDVDLDSRLASIDEFQTQLAWREFYTHVLDANPDAVSTNFKAYDTAIDWRTDPEGLQAWKDGETGYPIVDAGMRQLREEAWMHNRVRMIVASFLTKDLLIDWRRGYEWFRQRLVDHDAANDSGGWQWAASTGTDAQPYFRVFNPMTQGERYDPDAEYIARYVPELDGVEPDVIHGWHELTPTQRARTAPDYPAPIVDHADRREQAISMFEHARGE